MTEVENQPNMTEETKKVEEKEIEKVDESVKVEDKNDDDTTPKNQEQESSEDDKTSKNESNDGDDDISKLESDIVRQIEYYFGDSNLRRDRFLLEQIAKNDDGWLPFSVLLTFKRLAALTTDVDVIVNAMMKSDEGLIEISDDKTKIRRHPERPIPEFNEEIRKEIATRTAYVKGFPLNAEMSELISFFNPFEKVLNIVMRKYLDKPTKTNKFKGSVFVTFAKKEQCEEFMNKEKVEYNGTDLIRKWQEKYLEEKKKEREEINAKRNKKAKKEENKIELPKGTVLHFEGSDENTTRETIKEAFIKLNTDVAFIEYTKGEKSGYIRLANENAAKEFLDKLEDKKLKVGSIELTLRTLTEEEEKEFLEKVVDQMKSRRNNQNKNKGRKRKMSDKSESEPITKK